MLTAILNIWLELSPWLLLGAFAAGLLHVLVPAAWMQKHLSGRMGVLKAVLIGIPLPLCSCGVIPVGLGLRKSGASHGAAVGFLISTPQTGVDSILVSASFLGWPFAFLKVVVALLTGLLGGWIADLPEHQQAAATPSEPLSQVHAANRWNELLQHSSMLIQSIWGWLVIGVLVSAFISWMVPEQSLAGIPALSGLSALLITLLISLPLYICATASVPIAAALVAGGLPPGAALVFLMAGPATNVATLGAVYRALGGRSLLVYLVSIVSGSLLAGLVFNQLLVMNVAHLHAHEHLADWWRMASAIVLAAVIARFAYEDAAYWLKKWSPATTGAGPALTVRVAGMTCNGCAAKLERALQATSTVQSARVSFQEGKAVVQGTASLEEVRATVASAGFRVTEEDPAEPAIL